MNHADKVSASDFFNTLLEPMEARSSAAAVSRARALAAKEAGAIAFSRSGDPDIGEFADAVVLFREGDVPSDIPFK